MVEGLSGLVSKAVSEGIFEGFQFGDGNVVVSHLQNADDSLIVGEAAVQNVWALKPILRWFELVSSLKVNFLKSKFFCVNLEGTFLENAAGFLN